MAAAKPHTYGPGEELANVITHSAGMGLAIAGLVILMVLTAGRGDLLRLLTCAVFGGALVVLYGGSALYHGARNPRWRAVTQALDHVMIYILIAATYTPFTLVTLRGPWGWSIFFIVWGLALLGVVREIVWKGRPKWLSIVLYLAMGWVIVVAMKPLVERLPAGGLWLLLAGGIVYTVGTVFYALKKVPYMHTVWHLFVIGGSVCHFLAVAFYVA